MPKTLNEAAKGVLAELGIVPPYEERDLPADGLTPEENMLLERYQNGSIDETTWQGHLDRHPALHGFSGTPSRTPSTTLF